MRLLLIWNSQYILFYLPFWIPHTPLAISNKYPNFSLLVMYILWIFVYLSLTFSIHPSFPFPQISLLTNTLIFFNLSICLSPCIFTLFHLYLVSTSMFSSPTNSKKFVVLLLKDRCYIQNSDFLWWKTSYLYGFIKFWNSRLFVFTIL